MEENAENSSLLSRKVAGSTWRHKKKILYRSFLIWVIVMIFNTFLKPLIRSDKPSIIKYQSSSPKIRPDSALRLLESKAAINTKQSISAPEDVKASLPSKKTDSVILPYLSKVPGAFRSKGIWRTWEGSFYSTSPGILAPSTSGIAVLNFTTEPVTNNPIIELALAESNHLDARILRMRVNMRYSAHDTERGAMSLSADQGVEYVANSTFSCWVRQHEQHQDHGLSLQLQFGTDSLEEVGDKSHETRFVLSVPVLGLKVQGLVRRGAELGLLAPVFPPWYVSLFVVVVFGFTMVFVWVIVHSESKIGGRMSETAAGQGTITPFSIGFINLNLGFWTLEIIERYNSFFLAAMRGFYVYILIIWIVSGLGVFGKIVQTLHTYQGQFAYTMGRILFLLFLGMCFFHDRFVTGPYYDQVMMGFFCYPLLQVIYIALFARTSKENYWVPSFHILQYVATLGLVYWYHGYGSSFLNLKPRPDILIIGLWTTAIGLTFIHLQSVFGRFFCCCCTDNNQSLQSQQLPQVDINIAGQPEDDSDDQIDPNPEGQPNAGALDPDEQRQIQEAIELVRQMELEERRAGQPGVQIQPQPAPAQPVAQQAGANPAQVQPAA